MGGAYRRGTKTSSGSPQNQTLSEVEGQRIRLHDFHLRPLGKTLPQGGMRSRSNSKATTRPTRLAHASVSVPVPAPISTTTSSGVSSASRRMPARMVGLTRKCCPKRFLGRGANLWPTS